MDLVDRSGELRPHLEAGEKLLWHGSPDPPEGSGVAAEYRLFMDPYFMLPVYGLNFSMIATANVVVGLLLVVFFTMWGYGYFVRPVFTPWSGKKYLIYTPWYAKKSAVYGVTNRRALIKRHHILSWTPVLFEQVMISRPRDPGHANVSIGKSGFRFADVTDGDAMLAALHQAGTAVPARAG